MSRARTPALPAGDLLNALLRAVADHIAPLVTASAGDGPRWRTVAAEAERRGFPSPRALRDFCREHGVTVRGAGKHQVVAVDDLDAAFDRLPAGVPDSATPRVRRDAKPDNDPMDGVLEAAGLRRVAGGKAAR
jgi:hypothetical protein